ncbi:MULTISPECIES: hypothetical protein [unclassified Ruegeria]|uniref:hypothetical protein n=1 Tax=unclassified Ruegeria TaxID=2625375 RepID=UPI0014881EC8|nr:MULTISPECIES: hypothetical protein [unclassified Ruegeria]
MTLSSIFSSKRWTPLGTLILSAALGFGLILSIEYWIRSLGAVPSVENTIARWALVRSQVEKDTSSQAVVLLGASRAQSGLSHDVLRKAMPGANIYNLAYVGKAPYEALADIADNTDFSGLVIVSFLSTWLLPDQGRHDQVEMVQYYHSHWNLARAAETKMGNAVASHMVLRNNNHSFSTMVRNIAQTGRPIRTDNRTNIIITGDDRQQYLTVIDVDRAQQRATDWAAKVVAEGNSVPQDFDWDAAYADLSEKIGKIQARGGSVILVRMPSADIVYETESQFFPRAQYWDKMIEAIPAKGIHFEDVPGVETIDIPDFSHVPASERDAFSELMVEAIVDTLRAEGSTRFDFQVGNNSD